MHPYRSILMAPTTILAAQLYEEAQKFLPDLRIALVTNATKKGSLEDYDFIIGTHALLHRPLPEAGLVMVDEQHRFGTAQRHALTKLTDNDTSPHYLQFSATPIPRTQAMIDSAHIDVSLIVQTPFTKNIATRIIGKSDFPALLEHIRSEIAQNHQVLIVYPLVEQSESINYQSIEEARGYWEKNFENVYVTHGKDKEKEGGIDSISRKRAYPSRNDRSGSGDFSSASLYRRHCRSRAIGTLDAPSASRPCEPYRIAGVLLSLQQ